MKKNNVEIELDFFKETFKLLNVEPRKFEYRLKSHPFDRNQKKLLEAFYFFKKNNKQLTLQRLTGPPLDHPFLEATRLYLLGLAQNHYGVFKFSVEHLTQSVKTYEFINEKEFVVYALTTLVLAHGNMKNLLEMEKAVDHMNSYTPGGDFSRLLMVQAEVQYLVQAGQLIKAEHILNRTFKKAGPSLDAFRPSFLIIQFSILLKKSRFKNCFDVLEQYKETKGFVVKTNYTYMKSLLDHLVDEKALYVYEADFKDYPELFHQLEVIKALSRGDIDRAWHFWGLLAKHNPMVYQDQFNYVAEYSLFSMAIHKYAVHAKSLKLDRSQLAHCKGPLEKIQFIFSETDSPISKANIIELIWNEELTEKSMNRLRKLVFEYNQKIQDKIISHQDSYKKSKAS